MIICTGVSGFIGRHLTKALNADWVPGQVPLLREADALIHLGGISDTTCKDEQRLIEANVKLTLELADSAADAGIPFIYASSASIYGNGRGPLNAYARSKAAIDASMANRSDEWYGLRLFNVYGDGEGKKGDQASMVYKAVWSHRNGKTPEFFTPKARRDYVHVSDVVKVILWFVRTCPRSGVYDVGTGESTSIKEVCDLAQDISPFIRRMAATEMRGMYKHPSLTEIPVPSHMFCACQMDTKADLTRLRSIGYDAPFLSLEEGIKLL